MEFFDVDLADADTRVLFSEGVNIWGNGLAVTTRHDTELHNSLQNKTGMFRNQRKKRRKGADYELVFGDHLGKLSIGGDFVSHCPNLGLSNGTEGGALGMYPFLFPSVVTLTYRIAR